MACGCGGTGQWQSDGLVPAKNIFDESYFWSGDDLIVPPGDDAPGDDAPGDGYASWSAETGTTRTPPAGE